MSELIKSTTNILNKNVVTLKAIFDEISLDGIKDDIIGDILVAIGEISSEKESIDSILKGIDEKKPTVLKEYQSDPDKKLNEEENTYMQRVFGRWLEDRGAAELNILNKESSINKTSIEILTKENLIEWIKFNKKALKASASASLYKLMLKTNGDVTKG